MLTSAEGSLFGRTKGENESRKGNEKPRGRKKGERNGQPTGWEEGSTLKRPRRPQRCKGGLSDKVVGPKGTQSFETNLTGVEKKQMNPPKLGCDCWHEKMEEGWDCREKHEGGVNHETRGN